MRFQTTPAVESVFRGLSPGEKRSTTPASPSRRDQRSSRPDDPVVHGHDAGRLAQERRSAAVAAGTSFISDTVFSHPSKLDRVRDAAAAGYFVHLYVLVVPRSSRRHPRGPVCRRRWPRCTGRQDPSQAQTSLGVRCRRGRLVNACARAAGLGQRPLTRARTCSSTDCGN